ncbi:MAG: cell wall hydrolase [Pegethrix bostrychoides GSE-TBD4-15B]|uniref:Cell wall hydrolase n=1 Tax=Pegethrix bostrychoides GSE-TBD4-15B TaxID=2839662 RepID=A0A951U505_9CYAN|nr:cell wall hydrolase [Pegethrix bostrychoides GSE-TBD4-15B]
MSEAENLTKQSVTKIAETAESVSSPQNQGSVAEILGPGQSPYVERPALNIPAPEPQSENPAKIIEPGAAAATTRPAPPFPGTAPDSSPIGSVPAAQNPAHKIIPPPPEQETEKQSPSLASIRAQVEQVKQYGQNAPDVAVAQVQKLQSAAVKEAVKNPEEAKAYQELIDELKNLAGVYRQEAKQSKGGGSDEFHALREEVKTTRQVKSAPERDSSSTEKLVGRVGGKEDRAEKPRAQEQGADEGGFNKLMKFLNVAAIAGVAGKSASDVSQGNYLGAAGGLAGGAAGALLAPFTGGMSIGIGAGIGNMIGGAADGYIKQADQARQYQVKASDIATRFGGLSDENLKPLEIQQAAAWSSKGSTAEESLQMVDQLRDKHVIGKVGEEEQQLVKALQELSRATGQNTDAMVNQYASYSAAGGEGDGAEYMAQMVGGAVKAGMENNLQQYAEQMNSARSQVVQSVGTADKDDKALKMIQSVSAMLTGGKNDTSEFLRENAGMSQAAMSNFLSTGGAKSYSYDSVAMQISGIERSQTDEVFITPERKLKNAAMRMDKTLDDTVFSQSGLNILGMNEGQLKERMAQDPNYLENVMSSENPDTQQAAALQDLIKTNFKGNYGRDMTVEDRQVFTQLAGAKAANNGELSIDAIGADGKTVQQMLETQGMSEAEKTKELEAERSKLTIQALDHLTTALNTMDETTNQLLGDVNTFLEQNPQIIEGLNSILGHLPDLIDWLGNLVTDKIPGLIGSLTGMTKTVTDFSGVFIKGVADFSKGIIDGVMQFGGVIGKFGADLGSTLVKAIMGFGEFLSKGLDGIATIFQNTPGLKSVGDTMKAGGNAIGGVMDGLGQLGQNAANMAGGIANNIMGGSAQAAAAPSGGSGAKDDWASEGKPPASAPSVVSSNGVPANATKISNEELYQLAAISNLEATTKMGRVDVAQSIFNRVNSGNYGDSVTDVIFAEGQYEPMFGHDRSEITDRASAAKFLAQNRGMSEEEALTRLDETVGMFGESSIMKNAADHVGGRTEFKGTTMYQHRVAAEDPLRSDGENFFHIGGGQTQSDLEKWHSQAPTAIVGEDVDLSKIQAKAGQASAAADAQYHDTPPAGVSATPNFRTFKFEPGDVVHAYQANSIPFGSIGAAYPGKGVEKSPARHEQQKQAVNSTESSLDHILSVLQSVSGNKSEKPASLEDFAMKLGSPMFGNASAVTEQSAAVTGGATTPVSSIAPPYETGRVMGEPHGEKPTQSQQSGAPAVFTALLEEVKKISAWLLDGRKSATEAVQIKAAAPEVQKTQIEAVLPKPEEKKGEKGKDGAVTTGGVLSGGGKPTASQQAAAGAVTGSADPGFESGIFTAPQSNNGGSADYHIDQKFDRGLGMQKIVGMFDQMAQQYDKQGRKIEFSNNSVAGQVYDSKASFEKKKALLESAFEAHGEHSASRDDANNVHSIDYYVPQKDKDRFDKSAENVNMLLPTIQGAKLEYASGGNYGNYVIMKDAQGKYLMQMGHGNDSKALPGNRTITGAPATAAKPAAAPAKDDWANEHQAAPANITGGAAPAPGVGDDKLFGGGSASLAAKIIGMSEGNRDESGGFRESYYGHSDPGNGAANTGSFSAQQGMAPEEADKHWNAKLKEQKAVFQQRAKQAGVDPNDSRLLMNYLDLYVQSPLAASDKGGFLDQLSTIKEKGVSDESILDARVASYYNPDTGRLDAPGLGNDEGRVRKDQARRQAELNAGIKVHLGGNVANSAPAATPDVVATQPTAGGSPQASESPASETAPVSSSTGGSDSALSSSRETLVGILHEVRRIADFIILGKTLGSERQMGEGIVDHKRNVSRRTDRAFSDSVFDGAGKVGGLSATAGLSNTVSVTDASQSNLDKVIGTYEAAQGSDAGKFAQSLGIQSQSPEPAMSGATPEGAPAPDTNKIGKFYESVQGGIGGFLSNLGFGSKPEAKVIPTQPDQYELNSIEKALGGGFVGKAGGKLLEPSKKAGSAIDSAGLYDASGQALGAFVKELGLDGNAHKLGAAGMMTAGAGDFTTPEDLDLPERDVPQDEDFFTTLKRRGRGRKTKNKATLTKLGADFGGKPTLKTDPSEFGAMAELGDFSGVAKVDLGLDPKIDVDSVGQFYDGVQGDDLSKFVGAGSPKPDRDSGLDKVGGFYDALDGDAATFAQSVYPLKDGSVGQTQMGGLKATPADFDVAKLGDFTGAATSPDLLAAQPETDALKAAGLDESSETLDGFLKTVQPKAESKAELAKDGLVPTQPNSQDQGAAMRSDPNPTVGDNLLGTQVAAVEQTEDQKQSGLLQKILDVLTSMATKMLGSTPTMTAQPADYALNDGMPFKDDGAFYKAVSGSVDDFIKAVTEKPAPEFGFAKLPIQPEGSPAYRDHENVKGKGRSIVDRVADGDMKVEGLDLKGISPGGANRGSMPQMNVVVHVTVAGEGSKEQARDGAKEGVLAAHDEFLARWEKGVTDPRNHPRMRTGIH